VLASLIGFLDAYVVNVAVPRCHGCAVPVPDLAATT
jgi:hypothetical protein